LFALFDVGDNAFGIVNEVSYFFAQPVAPAAGWDWRVGLLEFT